VTPDGRFFVVRDGALEAWDADSNLFHHGRRRTSLSCGSGRLKAVQERKAYPVSRIRIRYIMEYTYL